MLRGFSPKSSPVGANMADKKSQALSGFIANRLEYIDLMVGGEPETSPKRVQVVADAVQSILSTVRAKKSVSPDEASFCKKALDAKLSTANVDCIMELV